MMKRASTFGLAALALGVLTAASARADTCYFIPGVQNIDCSRPSPQAGAQGQPTAQAPEGSRLREILRRALQQHPPSAPAAAQMNAIADRLQAAHQRIDSAIANVAQPAAPRGQERLRQEYQAGLADYRNALRELVGITRDSAERANYQRLGQEQEAEFTNRAVQVGLYARPASPRSTAVSATPVPPPDRFQTCGEPDRRGIQTCYDAPRFGYSCRITHRQGGEIIWSGEQATCGSRVLEQRNAFFNLRPDPNAAPPSRFTMDAAETADTIRRLTADPMQRQALVAQLPASCQASFNAFLSTVDKRGSSGQEIIASYRPLDQVPECHDALKRLASGNGLALPERRLSVRARGAFEAAMDADPSQPIPAYEADQGGSGYDVGEVMDFGFALLNIAGGFAGVAGAIHHGGGASFSSITRSVPTGGQRGPTLVAPRTGGSDITGLGSH